MNEKTNIVLFFLFFLAFRLLALSRCEKTRLKQWKCSVRKNNLSNWLWNVNYMSLVLSERQRTERREAKRNRRNSTMFVFSFICLFFIQTHSFWPKVLIYKEAVILQCKRSDRKYKQIKTLELFVIQWSNLHFGS